MNVTWTGNLILAQLMTCGFLTGLIWIVQCLYYPAFARIEKAQFAEFHKFHTRTITYIVAPMMILELGTAAALVAALSASAISLVNLISILLLWASTFLISVPIHNRLAESHNLEQIQKLTRTNWPRTVLWTLRFLALWVWASQHIL